MLLTLADNLAHEGFEIIKAGDGEKGFTTALREHPDLILLDILMPVMDGLTMLKKLRQNDWGEHVPVIILTNLNSPTTISKAVESMDGFEEYLVKSDWKVEDVVTRVREKLKNNI